MSGLGTVLGRVMQVALGVKSLGLAIGLSLLAGAAAVTEGPALVRWLVHRHDAAPAASAKLNEAGASIAAGAIERQAAHDREVDHIRIITEEGAAHVVSVPGAADRAPAVAAALHDELCRSPSYVAEPDCAALRGDRRGDGTTAPDAGSAAPR